MDYVLKANALTKNYKHYKALDGLSMNVPRASWGKTVRARPR